MKATEPDTLEIQVDTDVHVPRGAAPRRVIEAIRRQLRPHELASFDGEAERRLSSLLQTRAGGHRLPQALLSRVTEACRKYGVPYAVVDRRAMVSCPAVRSRAILSASEEQALRQLLLRDSGVLVATDDQLRRRLAVELVARRQQRALVLVESKSGAAAWLEAFAQGLELARPHIAPLAEASPEAWIVVGNYRQVLEQASPVLSRDFGLVVGDGLSTVDALTLLRTVRAVGARYLLGLAAEAVRSDGLQGLLFVLWGGLTHRLAQPRLAAPLRLTCRSRTTTFAYPAYSGRAQYQAMITALAADRARAKLIADDVTREAQGGYPCLVLSERRDHLELLASLLPSELPRESITSSVRPAERQQIAAKFERGELSVLLATSQIAPEALATPRMQRLFFTFPFSYARKLEQVVRSLLTPAPGQQDAILFDYDDPQVEPLHRAFAKRALFLAQLRRESEQALQLPLPLLE